MSDYDHITQLRKSKQLIGELSPIIIDSDTEILAGVHREHAGFTRTYSVNTEKLARQWKVPRQVAKEMVRMHSNIQRRLKGGETKAMVLRMAEAFETEGKTPLQDIGSKVAEKTPYSERYIRKLLPDKYKHTEFANEAELVPPTPLKKTVIQPKETWGYRKARMSPQKSRMEVEAISELIIEGYPLETDVFFETEGTTPDAIHRRKRLAFYVDGAPHIKREEKDYVLREKMATRHQYTVIAVLYPAYSQGRKEALKQAFREALDE